MLPRKYTIKMYFIFPHHLTSASALPGLPGETENHRNCVFSLNCCMLFTKNTKHIKISSNYIWNILHCQNNRLGASDRT